MCVVYVLILCVWCVSSSYVCGWLFSWAQGQVSCCARVCGEVEVAIHLASLTQCGYAAWPECPPWAPQHCWGAAVQQLLDWPLVVSTTVSSRATNSVLKHYHLEWVGDPTFPVLSCEHCPCFPAIRLQRKLLVSPGPALDTLFP